MRHAVNAVLRRDLRLETRTPQVVPGMALFSISAFVVFHFALQEREDFDAAAIQWPDPACGSMVLCDQLCSVFPRSARKKRTPTEITYRVSWVIDKRATHP